jgi:hypothetical protein
MLPLCQALLAPGDMSVNVTEQNHYFIETALQWEMEEDNN